MKVLVIDDDPFLREVIVTILELSGFEVRTHSTCLHVLNMVKDFQPDLILLDINLKGNICGTETCREHKLVNLHPPILLFSSHDDIGLKFAECNADGFIRKPFDLLKFRNTINFHLNLCHA